VRSAGNEVPELVSSSASEPPWAQPQKNGSGLSRPVCVPFCGYTLPTRSGGRRWRLGVAELFIEVTDTEELS
jgi:hypothetical protein